MIRSAFENQLHALNTNLILMGSLCEEIISKSLRWWIVPRNLWYNVMQNGLLCSFVAVTDIFI